MSEWTMKDEKAFKLGEKAERARLRQEVIHIISIYFQSTKDDKVVFMGNKYSEFVKRIQALLGTSHTPQTKPSINSIVGAVTDKTGETLTGAGDKLT